MEHFPRKERFDDTHSSEHPKRTADRRPRSFGGSFGPRTQREVASRRSVRLPTCQKPGTPGGSQQDLLDGTLNATSTTQPVTLSVMATGHGQWAERIPAARFKPGEKEKNIMLRNFGFRGLHVVLAGALAAF